VLQLSDILTGVGALATLFGVLVLTYYGTRWYARRVGGYGAGKDIKVHERVPLGSNAYLAIIEVGARYYLIGVSEKGVNLLNELEGFTPASDARPHSKVPFEKLLADMMQKIGGRGSKGDDRSDG